MDGLALRGLKVRFPGFEQPVLDIPSLDLRKGARVAVTGPSGSGKTTFINILTGLERPLRGEVIWFGADLAKLGEAARDEWRAANVGLVMQEFHLFPGLSAFENVVLPWRLSHFRLTAPIRDEAERLLGRAGLADQRDQSVETLSRGQMQRVALARALLARPAILVADEPTASLDAEAGAGVASLLLELAADAGATLIVASHDPRLIGRMQRVLLLDAGRIVEG